MGNFSIIKRGVVIITGRWPSGKIGYYLIVTGKISHPADGEYSVSLPDIVQGNFPAIVFSHFNL